jgi:hypothetical protein
MKGDGQPAVHVLSLAFDGLDIPFENVFTPSETDLREEVMTLLADQSVFKEQLENIKARWNSGYITPEINIANSFTTTKNALTKILDTQTPPANSLGTVDPASATDPKATNDAKTLVVLKAHCTELNALVTTISSINNEQTNELYRAVVTEKNGGATLANIETVNNQLSVIQQRLLSGGDITTLKTKVTSIKDRIAHTKEIIDFTETAAQQLSTKELNDYLKELGDATETDAAAFIKKHGKAIDSVNQVYETLKASRTVKIVPDFDPDGYKAMK